MRRVLLGAEMVEPVLTAIWCALDAKRAAKSGYQLGTGHALAHRCADEARS